MKNEELSIDYYKGNPMAFIEDYFQGHDEFKKLKVGLLEIYPFERQVLESFFSPEKIFITKSRQMFFSTMILKYLFYQIVFGEEQNILVITANKAMAINLKNRLMTTVDRLPEYLKPEFKYNNQLQLKTKKCRIEFAAPSANAGCSSMFNTLIIDETAYLNNLSNIWMAIMPALYPDGKIIMGTSLNNSNEDFCKFYEGVLKPENQWKHIYLHWSENPLFNQNLTYDEANKPSNDWYVSQCEILQSKHVINQELDCIYDRDLFNKKQKDRIITFRVDEKLEKQLSALILKRTMSEGKSFNISDYLRELIQKNMVENGL